MQDDVKDRPLVAVVNLRERSLPYLALLILVSLLGFYGNLRDQLNGWGFKKYAGICLVGYAVIIWVVSAYVRRKDGERVQPPHKWLARVSFVVGVPLLLLAIVNPMPSPQAQLLALVPQGYAVIQNEQLTFDTVTNLRLMQFSPDARLSSTRSDQLRIYTPPGAGPLKQLFAFTPQLVQSRLKGLGFAGESVPGAEALRISIVIFKNLKQSVGNELLMNVYDPQLPALGVIPMILSEDPATQHFSVEPLLTLQGIGAPISAKLSSKYLMDNWARLVWENLYSRPVTIRNATPAHFVVAGFPMVGYALAPSQPLNPGRLTIAAGYVARGGNIPTPSVMQVLLWRIDLSHYPFKATAFSAQPNFATFPPSATGNAIDCVLENAAKGLPPSGCQ